ncbi:MAG: chemotaxis protein methyltransferase CheR [Actinomycetota bacterium]|jgi:chemotaxis protein methyltransferase CheR
MTEGNALEEVGRLLSRRVGLRLDPAIRGRLERAVRDEALRHGENETDYVKRLEADPERLQELLNRVTVQETSFFRDPGQFAAFSEHVVPTLQAQGGRVEIWSAGCANGQEPYSLAMTLAESGIADWHVIASDVSTDALGRTRAARYADRELRGLSSAQRASHLVPLGGGEWQVTPELRDRVTTIRHNLAADAPPITPGQCEVVFCRNVLIYFGHDDVVAFLDRLKAALPPEGYLFLGYSESLWQVTDRFQLVRLGDAFAYRPAPNAPKPESPQLAESSRVRPSPPAPPRPLPSPPKAPRPRPAPPESVPQQGVVELMADGEAALGRGEHGDAVTAFRKAAYLDPDHPIAHLNLGLALEVAGDIAAARRAYAAARAAIDRCDTAAVEATLEGYHLDGLTRLLERKLQRS